MFYFPLQSDRFEHQFGVRALTNGESIVEVSDHYTEQIQLKRDLLKLNRENYCCLGQQTLPIQREAANCLIGAAPHLTHQQNRMTHESLEELGDEPLLAIAMHLQEDLVILDGDGATGNRVLGGVVCFPSGWSIADKVGRALLEVHSPVPDYAKVMDRPTERLLDRLKPGRPVWRMNWGVRPSSRLDQSPQQSEAIAKQRSNLSLENVADECQFRVERQTLSRLPDCGDVLFTIHTHQCSLGELAEWQRRNLLGVLQTCPVQTLEYKGILAFRQLVQTYLANSLNESAP